ncbi:hypothetical protein BV898_05824 [Hypsibius exemplaris]|uniref:Uncharacterized protein n=1 Tax=Hypsibius exemplaris TaxID=2072580 RepID=A0A1W0WYK9_HYPEX|nr:hypothetical protein BV898_05824 [Hypsibius exemplaris]
MSNLYPDFSIEMDPPPSLGVGPMPDFIFDQAQRIVRSAGGLADARVSLASPATHLNHLLDNEHAFHRQTILKIVNQIGQELPEEFQTEGSFEAFYRGALEHLKKSPRLAVFMQHEIPACSELDLETAVGMAEHRLADWDERIQEAVRFGPAAGGDPMEGEGIERVCCRVMVRYQADDIRERLGRLSQSSPEMTLFLKGATVQLRGRVFDGVSLELRLRGMLPRAATKAKKSKAD